MKRLSIPDPPAQSQALSHNPPLQPRWNSGDPKWRSPQTGSFPEGFARCCLWSLKRGLRKEKSCSLGKADPHSHLLLEVKTHTHLFTYLQLDILLSDKESFVTSIYNVFILFILVMPSYVHTRFVFLTISLHSLYCEVSSGHSYFGLP